MEDILKDVVVFGAAWCANCKTVKKMFEEQGTAFTYIDVDSAAGAALAKDWNVRALPQGWYNGKMEFATPNQARNFLKRHGAEVAPVVNENVEGIEAVLKGNVAHHVIVDELAQPEMVPEQIRHWRIKPQEADRVRI